MRYSMFLKSSSIFYGKFKMAFIDKDELCKSWDKNGKSEFLKTCKSLIGSQTVIVEHVNSKDLKRALYELCSLAISGRLKVEQVGSTLVEIADMHLEISSLLADLFCVIDVEIMCTEEPECRERFVNLVIACLAVVPENLLKERLDADTLENMGMIQSKNVFQQKYVKTKTKLYYKQQKFNLLREESEGYAKLVTELEQDTTYDVVLQNIKSLIGCFNLDPNRVLDIILESFECRPDQTALFIPLLKEYAPDIDTLCHVLGFKFHFYQQTDDSVTPHSMYHLTALLLQNGLVDIRILYSHLSPPTSEMIEKCKKEMAEAKEYQRKSAIVSLADKTVATDAKDKEDKDKSDQVSDNQKLGLCDALIKIGAWQHAKSILDAIPPFSAVSNRPIAQSLCSLISYIIEPLYASHSGLPKAILNKHVISKLVNNVAQAKVFSALPDLAFPILRYLGPHLACDPVLLVKINRLAKVFMEKKAQLKMDKDAESDVFAGFLTTYDEVILPSLSLMPNNCCMSEEIWGFIKLLKYEHRYRLYGQWKNESRLSHARLMRAHTDILEKAKYIMKRLSKENIKPLGRQLGKLSHSAPGVVFEYILSQIQKYDNFIGPVVDSLKFLTNMSYDVLLYCVIEALANPEKEKLKTDDTNISFWLQCLANFSGCVLKKYQIDIAGLLQYIANQLKAQKSYDLIILREVIQKMAGIEVSEEITNDQLLSMCGGELLRQEGGYFTQVRNTKKSSGRLMDSLQEHDLVIPMCLLMAQQRQGIVYPQITDQSDDKRHLKLIGKLYDQCQDTLVQFISFITLQLSPDELVKRLPPIYELLTTYHVPVEVAFGLWRIVYSASVTAKLEDLKKAEKKEKTSSSQPAKIQQYLEAVEVVMQPVRELVRPIHQPKVWEEVSLQFYTTFWTLTMYDLQIPSSAYDRQIHLHKSQAPMEDEKDASQSKKKKEKERCTQVVDKLADEEKRQQEHVKMIMARLRVEKDSWFPSKTAKHSLITNLLQYCIFPRLCLTAIDAVYCAKFLYTMHTIKTPNFSSLICLDRIFSDIAWSMCSCTESEAHRYGRFLCALLEDVMRWHGDKNVFDKECWTAPGFVTVFRAPGTYQNFADQLDYENYRHVVHKWHYSLTRVAVNSLESGDFVQIRNMIIILTKILPHYPRVVKFGQALERRVDRVIEEEKEKRPDVYVLALGYSGQMKNSKKSWLQDLDFHKKDFEVRVPQSATTTENGGTPAASATPAAASSLASATASNSTIATKSQNGEKSSLTNSTSASRTDAKELTRDGKEISNKLKDKQKGVETRNEVERTERERKSETHGRDKKQEDKDEKSRLGLDKGRDVDERTKDRGHRSLDVERTENRAVDREADAHQSSSVSSSADGTPGSHHGSEGHRRSADSGKQIDERDSKRRKVDGSSTSKESPGPGDHTDKVYKTPTTSGERERPVVNERGERTISVVRSVKDPETDRKLSRAEKHDRKRVNDTVERDGEELGELREIKRQRSVESSTPPLVVKEKHNSRSNEKELRDRKRDTKDVELSSRSVRDTESDKTSRKNEASTSRLPAREDVVAKDRTVIVNTEDGVRDRIRLKDDVTVAVRERARTREDEPSTSDGRKSVVKDAEDKERRSSSDKRGKKSKHR